MKCVELNPAGDFNHWEISKLEELQENKVSNFPNNELFFEDERVYVWEIKLESKKRIPFRRINSNYSFVTLTNILAISRSSNAAIKLISLNKGTYESLEFKNKNMICDVENISNEMLHVYIIKLKEH